MSHEQFYARIWGARGSLTCIKQETQKYGGNTACVEVMCGQHRLIFDAGSGLRLLGEHLIAEEKAITGPHDPHLRTNLFFTHCHYDHIAGFPFFSPFFSSDYKIDIWSGHLSGKDKTKCMINDYMKPPFFPVGDEIFCAQIAYRDFEAKDVLTPVEGVVIRTISLDHHDGCIGYRVEFDGRAICYITDTSHTLDQPNKSLIDFIQGADLLIYDSTYTDAEFSAFADYGHSTWQEGVRLTKAADVKRYCIFHHCPGRTDAALDEILRQCRQEFEASWAAYEGLLIEV